MTWLVVLAVLLVLPLAGGLALGLTLRFRVLRDSEGRAWIPFFIGMFVVGCYLTPWMLSEKGRTWWLRMIRRAR
jgi:hypothetical protein